MPETLAQDPAAEAAPRRPRGRPRKSAQHLDESGRRRELMEQAARLFLVKGYAATTTRDIAAAVGMHSGSPFYYFKSKSALLYAVMREGMEGALASQQQALDKLAPEADAHARLRALIRHHFDILLGPASGFIPVMLYEWRSLTAAQKKGVSQVKDTYEAAWMPALEALAAQGDLRASPAVARLFIFGALNWSVQWFRVRGSQTLDGLTEQALHLFAGKA
ncbi:TetR family transcriptional regulator [Comamonas flocculans]|uniref:TetR/AcrR family transcriptional regulator n=1 Tax=Comamonas flocculans TaxID=2597701 RepID=A0A5B8RZF0_9BURK|nr:TetR family transcriptional regulator [Comamonas flocculans]QEA13287.1 TetR/AcrR family transcriptional regulator [Comamonas flocculans]